MKSACKFLLILNVLKLCLCENIWHSHQFSGIHQNREELTIKNVTLDDNFQLKYNVTKWTSLCTLKKCFIAGLMEKSIAISLVSEKVDRKGFEQSAYQLQLNSKPVEIVLFERWNSSRKDSEAIAVIVTDQIEWFKLSEEKAEKFWTWPIEKKISHVNFFEIDYKPHLLVFNENSLQISADLYEFDLRKEPNFWLKNSISLSNIPTSSAFSTVGPDYFLSIPQKSLEILKVYRLSNDHFVEYKNISSPKINEVISFKIGRKSFLAFNGFEASIYEFTKNGLEEQVLEEGNLDGVHFWLPIELNSNREDTILVAQRVLEHDFHQSFVIEVITYNGVKFEEHEDVGCLYFGEMLSGLTCLSGEDSRNGIIGAATVAFGNNLGILIPRNGTSELFIVETEIVKIPNPVLKEVEELTKTQNHLDDLIIGQEREFEELNKKVADSEESQNSKLIKLKLRLLELENIISKFETELNATESNQFEKIIFNENIQVFGDVSADQFHAEKIENKSTQSVLEDIVMKNSISFLTTNKKFMNLQVEDIDFEFVNEISASDLLFSSESSVTLDNNLIIEKPLLINQNIEAKTVNNMILKDEVVEFNKSFSDKLVFDNVEVLLSLTVENMNNLPMFVKRSAEDTSSLGFEKTIELNSLYIPHNVEVINLNNENFSEFLNEICMKNVATYIPGLTNIEGNIEVIEDAQTDFLNDLKFPEAYVFSNDIATRITGKKNFTSNLITNEVHCKDTINNIDPDRIITLSSDQNITGTITFNATEATENFDFFGKVTGEHPQKFLSNPNITETDMIKANVLFKELEVKGSIVLLGKFNEQNFEETLADIVYNDEKDPIIEAFKEFPDGLSVQKNLKIKSNKINNIDLNSIITTNTEQTLNFSTIDGIVNFGNIKTEGLFNGINVTELDQNVVKLTGDQYISSTLIFNHNIEAEDLQITETIPLSSQEITFIKSEEEIKDSVSLDSVFAENIVVEGNFSGEIQDFNLKEFSEKKLSFQEEQELDFSINKSHIENFKLTGTINGISVNELSLENLKNKIKKQLERGHISIESLQVNGSLNLKEINDKSAFSLGDSLWKEGMNLNVTELIFKDNVFFNTIEITNLSSVNFTRFIDKIVFKNDSNVKLAGKKIFIKGITVEKLIETETLNTIPIKNILTKFGVQEIKGPIRIHGNVTFLKGLKNCETINNITVQEFLQNYSREQDKYKVMGEVIFSRLAYIRNLQINGFAKEKPVQAHLDSIIYKNGDYNLSNEIVFANNVAITGNMRVLDEINQINLPEFVSKLVIISKDTTLKSPVRFTQPIFIKNRISFFSPLKTTTLNEITPESWLDEAVFINRGFLLGNYIFGNVELNSNLQTDFLNKIDTKTLIPLRTKQSFNDSLSFAEVSTFNNVHVGNSTNLHNLSAEYLNTVLLNTNEEILSDIEFAENVFIDSDIRLNNRNINAKKFDLIVTTNTAQELSAVYDFKRKTTFDQDVIIPKGSINGINLYDWSSSGLKLNNFNQAENIDTNWHVQNDLVFESDVTGDGLINGKNLQSFKNEIEERRNYKYSVERDAIETYKNICKDLRFMHSRLLKQIYKFNYLEMHQVLDFDKSIRYIHHFKFNENYYVLINEEKQCHSHLYKFSDGSFRISKKLYTGQIKQIISVFTNNLIYFATRNYEIGCEIGGTNLWQLVEDDILHVLKIENLDLLQDSAIPGTFYGLTRRTVIEFQLIVENEVVLRKYRKWELNAEEDVVFAPRGLATGLAVRAGTKLIRLSRDEPVVEVEESEELNYNSEIIINGNFSEEYNVHLPYSKNGDFVVMKVGIRSSKRSLLAVASHEETSVKGRVDFIKIYEDVFSGKIFTKIPSYKPSSLTSLEFNNGETILAFLENESILQVYEYRGIEGFKHKFTSRIRASKLFTLSLPLAYNKRERKILGLVDGKSVSFIEAVMLGNQIDEHFQCLL